MFLQKKILKVATDPQYTIYVGYYLYHKEHYRTAKTRNTVQNRQFFQKNRDRPRV